MQDFFLNKLKIILSDFNNCLLFPQLWKTVENYPYLWINFLPKAISNACPPFDPNM